MIIYFHSILIHCHCNENPNAQDLGEASNSSQSPEESYPSTSLAFFEIKEPPGFDSADHSFIYTKHIRGSLHVSFIICLYGGVLKCGYLRIIPFNRIFPYKASSYGGTPMAMETPKILVGQTPSALPQVIAGIQHSRRVGEHLHLGIPSSAGRKTRRFAKMQTEYD